MRKIKLSDGQPCSHVSQELCGVVIGQFSRTKNAGKMASKRALDLGHVRFGQEVNMAEVVEV